MCSELHNSHYSRLFSRGGREISTHNKPDIHLAAQQWMDVFASIWTQNERRGGSLTRPEARRVKSYFKVRFLSVMVPFKGAGSITVWGCCVWRASVVLLVALSNILSLFLEQNSGSARTLRLCSAAAWQENDHTAGRAGVI